MANHGWAKLNNAPYTRMKLNLCPGCVFFQHASTREDPRDRAWHLCQAKGTQISVAKTDKGRCEDYSTSGEMRLSEAEIEAERQTIREHREYKERMKSERQHLRDVFESIEAERRAKAVQS
jgi:hypothetical protein